MDSFEGKVAVVTGGASGIGLSLAQRFGAAGMHVAIADIETDALHLAEAELREAGVDVAGFVADVSDADAMDALRDEVFERFGTAHVVCLNAGVGSGGMMQSLTTNDWAWCLGVNLWGVIHGIRVFLPRLVEQAEGHIVNTASVAGLFAAPFMGPYNASKFAVVAISETLFNELAMSGSNVGVSVLCPAWVATRIHESDRNRPQALRDAPSDEAALGMSEVLRNVIESGMPPSEVAEAVFAAVSDKRFYILTHEESTAAVTARMQAIVDDGTPPFFMPQ